MTVLTLAVVAVGWLLSLCLHEYAHARIAYVGGDWTVREKGYLSFNPLRYTDPVASVALPMLFLLLGGIGLPGGAVYIETWRLRSRAWRAAVAAAGPAANLLLAPVLGWTARHLPAQMAPAAPGVAFLAYLQVMAVAFNLLPVPPLDGYGILRPYLGAETARRFDRAGRWTLWALLAALWFLDPVSDAFWSAVSSAAAALGVPLGLAHDGLRHVLVLRG